MHSRPKLATDISHVVSGLVRPCPTWRLGADPRPERDIDGLIIWPQLMFVADGTGAWVTHSGGAILTAQDKVGYTVRLNPDAHAGDPADAVRPNEYRDVTLAHWVTTINPDRPAHLVPVEYPTRGIAWTGLCGGRFNAGGYAGANHRPRCTPAC